MKNNSSNKAKNSIIDVFDGSFKYDNDVLNKHDYYTQYHTTVKTLEKTIENNCTGRVNLPEFKVVEAIDLDNLEKILKKGGYREKTCDTCIGISKESDQKSPRILLIEFKLNLKNPINQSSDEIKDKINYSKQLMQNEHINIYNKTIIIIPEKNFEIARKTIMKGLNNRWDVICHKIDDLRKLL